MDDRMAGIQRVIGRLVTEAEQLSLFRTAEALKAEQAGGRVFTFEEFWIALLTRGLAMSAAEAKRIANFALWDGEVPPGSTMH
jgi:hypothetical protein